MALGVYEVVWVACQSHSWFVLYVSGETTRQTSDANDYVDAKSPCAEVHGEGADKGKGRGESIFSSAPPPFPLLWRINLTWNHILSHPARSVWIVQIALQNTLQAIKSLAFHADGRLVMRDESPKKSAREATKSHAGEKPLQLAHGILYNCILLPIVKYWARRVAVSYTHLTLPTSDLV